MWRVAAAAVLLSQVIEPGDVLITTCTYDSTARSNATRFGYGSSDEMCFNFMSYWPAVPGITFMVGEWGGGGGGE